MHASASPFEAMAERLNWVGASLEDDAFGKALLASGIPKNMILEWTKDPQVAYEGKKASLFDLLGDEKLNRFLCIYIYTDIYKGTKASLGLRVNPVTKN